MAFKCSLGSPTFAPFQFTWIHDVEILHPTSLCSFFLVYVLSTHYTLGTVLDPKVPR